MLGEKNGNSSTSSSPKKNGRRDPGARYGLKTLRTSIETISPNSGHQVPLENGQCMMTNPAKVMSGNYVTACGDLYKVHKPRGRAPYSTS